MRKSDRKKVMELSLLENPDMETQARENSLKIVLRVVAITLLLALLIFGYVIKFSVSSYPQWFKVKFTGTFNASCFYNADDYDLIIVAPYENITDAKIGDIVCYATNLGKGSGELVGFQSNVFEIKLGDEIKRVSSKSIIGKQTKTIPVLGFFVEFIGSYYGIVTFNILLIAYVMYITFSRINYENTEKGIYLYNKFRLSQKEEKNRLKLLKKLNGLEDVTYEIVDVLEGEFCQKFQKLNDFNSDIKMNLKEKYKYILRAIHDAYLPKENLDKDEKRQIASLVELVCVPKDIDNDIEYMIIDLLLKTNLIDFDVESFSKSAIEFLNAPLDDDDLLNFGSMLYILVYNNKKYRDDLKELANVFLQKTQYLDRKDRESVFGTALRIVSLIK